MTYSIPLALLLVVISAPVWAKKNNSPPNSTEQVTSITANKQAEAALARIALLDATGKQEFEALSDEQKAKISSGEIENGFNAWMVKLALGEPFYASEHHPIFTDYQEVWLYTKKEIIDSKMENQIMDTQTNWPTIHRVTNRKTCTIGDFFVLWDRGVVEKISPDPEKKVFGSCTVESSEAYLPIVNGVPVEPKQ